MPIASAEPFPAVFPLANLLPGAGGDGSEGFVVNGINGGANSGTEVSAAGDVNGDGIDDLIITAKFVAPNGRTKASQSYVVFGHDTAQTGLFPAEFELGDLLPEAGGDGSAGFVLSGIDAYDFAYHIGAADDINGDGIDDLIIGAAGADPHGRTSAGQSYVVFGRDTDLVGNFPAIFPLASLLPSAGGDGSAGFVLNGIDARDESGIAVSAAGDVNGDGIGDLVIGAPEASPPEAYAVGESYVVFGRDTSLVGNFPAVFPLANLLPGAGGDGKEGFVLRGIPGFIWAGYAVGAAGDINGDGLDDLIVGGYDKSYVVFGRDTGLVGNFPAVMPLADLLPSAGGDGSIGFVLSALDAYDRVSSVGAAGDVNGDGVGDVIIGAPFADPHGRNSAGQSYVVFGRDTDLVGNFPAFFPLASLLPGSGGDGSAGFVLNGIDAFDQSGRSASAAGDVNGDGLGDVIIGALGASRGGLPERGESYVVLGRDTAQAGNFPALLPLGSLFPVAGGDGSVGFVLMSIDAGDHSGSSVSAAGDINGDGRDDLIVGAPYGDPGGRGYAGESYVVFGRAEPPIKPSDSVRGR